MATAMEKRLAAKAAATPSEGFNLVAFDDFEEAGEELTVVGHFATEAEAMAAKADRESADPDEKLFIYGAG